MVAADRPPANAMDVTLLRDLVAAVEELAADPPAAVLLTGRPGFFSAGADLKEVPGYGAQEQRAMVDGINRMALGVYALPCPVVGAITSHAIAGGLVLAVCTDLRVASSAGKYGLTEVRVGVPYPQAAIGVVDEVVEPDAVLPRAQEIARDLAALPADVYARTKADLRGATIERLRAAAADDPLLARWV